MSVQHDSDRRRYVPRSVTREPGVVAPHLLDKDQRARVIDHVFEELTYPGHRQALVERIHATDKNIRDIGTQLEAWRHPTVSTRVKKIERAEIAVTDDSLYELAEAAVMFQDMLLRGVSVCSLVVTPTGGRNTGSPLLDAIDLEGLRLWSDMRGGVLNEMKARLLQLTVLTGNRQYVEMVNAARSAYRLLEEKVTIIGPLLAMADAAITDLPKAMAAVVLALRGYRTAAEEIKHYPDRLDEQAQAIRNAREGLAQEKRAVDQALEHLSKKLEGLSTTSDINDMVKIPVHARSLQEHVTSLSDYYRTTLSGPSVLTLGGVDFVAKALQLPVHAQAVAQTENVAALLLAAHIEAVSALGGVVGSTLQITNAYTAREFGRASSRAVRAARSNFQMYLEG